MSQKKLFINAYLVFFSYFIYSCQSTNSSENQSFLSNSEKIEPQSPLLDNTQIPNASSLSSQSLEVIGIINSLEENFISSDCQNVLNYAKSLRKLDSSIDFNSLPVLARASLYLCDSKAGIQDKNRVEKNLSYLENIPLKYPLFNEGWVSDTMANLYLSLNDKDKALEYKKKAQSYFLLQQQALLLLNSEILKLDPTNPIALSPIKPTNSLGGENTTYSLEQAISLSNQFISNGQPEQAFAVLETVPTSERNEQYKKIHNEVLTRTVKQLRFKVTKLFKKASQQSGSPKKDTLMQCQDILRGIIRNYPDYSEMNSIKNNLNQIDKELSRIQ